VLGGTAGEKTPVSGGTFKGGGQAVDGWSGHLEKVSKPADKTQKNKLGGGEISFSGPIKGQGKRCSWQTREGENRGVRKENEGGRPHSLVALQRGGEIKDK